MPDTSPPKEERRKTQFYYSAQHWWGGEVCVCHPGFCVPQMSCHWQEAMLIYTARSFALLSWANSPGAFGVFGFLTGDVNLPPHNFFVLLAMAQSPWKPYSTWDKHSALPQSKWTDILFSPRKLHQRKSFSHSGLAGLEVETRFTKVQQNVQKN